MTAYFEPRNRDSGDLIIDKLLVAYDGLVRLRMEMNAIKSL
jgi:hypothetical protein